MSPAQEQSYLPAILRRARHGSSRLFAGFWGPSLLWLSLVAISVVTLAAAPLIAVEGVALLFFALGGVFTYVGFRFSAARCWPTHARFLNQQAIEARLTELGSNISSKRTR